MNVLVALVFSLFMVLIILAGPVLSGPANELSGFLGSLAITALLGVIWWGVLKKPKSGIFMQVPSWLFALVLAAFVILLWLVHGTEIISNFKS